MPRKARINFYGKPFDKTIIILRPLLKTHILFSAKKYLVEVAAFCTNLSSKCPNAGVSEKLAVLEQLLENIIESNEGTDNVGVVFVNRRMTALALCDYFRTRKTKLEDETWTRITSTQYCRNVGNLDVEFAPSVIPQLSQDRIDFTNNQYQNITSKGGVLEAEAINNVLESVLPEAIHMKDIVDLDPSPIAFTNRNDCEQTGSGSKIINWYVKTSYSFFTHSAFLLH